MVGSTWVDGRRLIEEDEKFGKDFDPQAIIKNRNTFTSMVRTLILIKGGKE